MREDHRVLAAISLGIALVTPAPGQLEIVGGRFVLVIYLQFLIFVPLIIIGDIYVILNNMAFLDCFTEVLVSYGYIRHRIQHPAVHRPFKVRKQCKLVYFQANCILSYGHVTSVSEMKCPIWS